MTEENQKTDLGHLSRMWHEKLKGIRASMVKKYGRPNTDQSDQIPEPAGIVEVPSSNELFTGPVREELSAQQIFAGNQDLYKSLEDTHTPNRPQPINTEQISIFPTEYKRFSTTQKILAAAILVVAAVLLYELFIPIAGSPSDSTIKLPPATRKTPYYPEQPVTETAHLTPQQISEPQPAVDSAQPLSLKVAQTYYLNGDYAQALDVYDKLYASLPINPKEDIMRDFLQLQKALCMEKIADYNQAAHLFRSVLNSESPAVRVVACYNYSLLEMQKKQYINARTKAYQAIALIDAIDFNKDWSRSIKQDCYFLVAEAITREVLSLCDADKDLPKDLWGNFGAADELFTNLEETKLRTFLNSGSQRLSLATLSPQIQRFDHQDGQASFDITCNGASIEELLVRFAANSNVDLHWDLDSNETGISKQLVYLNFLSATKQQFTTVAAGCVGLLAQMDNNDVLNVLNPAGHSYISERISLLSDQAVSLWQEFLLKFPADMRLANVHFALGLLYASKDQPTESIAEYKLVANRFLKSPLAPYALLNSSKIKNSLHDYAGGHEDLKQLVEQFSDTEVASEAYLYFADTTAKANLTDEAIRLYNKVYNLDLSSESQIAAALGAGECSYRLGDYESAERWLSRYVGLAKDNQSKDLYSAYLFLGKTYLALKNPEAAYNAFQYALQGVPSYLTKEEYLESIPALIEVYMQQGHFVGALDLLENIYSLTLSPKESVGILLLKSRVFRTMGLVDKAVAILGDKTEYITDTQLKAEIDFQLCECYIEKGDLNFAYKKLTEILVLAKSGPLIYEATLRLGEVCLKLDQSSQTISVCLQLLDLQPSEQIKQKALKLLAMAYNQKENYDKAALALLGQWK
jgi:tetratricopeptide (TPR) repeat protein